MSQEYSDKRLDNFREYGIPVLEAPIQDFKRCSGPQTEVPMLHFHLHFGQAKVCHLYKSKQTNKKSCFIS